MRFQLAWSIDSESDPLIDERKIPEIRRLAKTGLYTFEAKQDGLRIGLGKKADGSITIPNRRGIDYAQTRNLPELERIAAMFPPDTMLDGEGTVMADRTYCDNKETCKCKPGYPCRLLSQRRAGSKTNYAPLISKLPIVFVTWDIRRLAGENLENEPYETRRRILRDFVEMANEAGNHDIVLIRSVESEEDAVAMFQAEPEGIMAKLKASKYIEMDEGVASTQRPRYWIKIKHTFLRCFDVAGYCLEAQGRLSGQMRNLVITENGEYRGTVGGGFSDQERREARAYLDRFPTVNPPWTLSSKVKHQWLYKPTSGLKLTAAYQAVMPSGIIFQPRMMGLIYPQCVAVAKENYLDPSFLRAMSKADPL